MEPNIPIEAVPVPKPENHSGARFKKSIIIQILAVLQLFSLFGIIGWIGGFIRNPSTPVLPIIFTIIPLVSACIILFTKNEHYYKIARNVLVACILFYIVGFVLLFSLLASFLPIGI